MWALALVKGIREPHEVKKKSFALGGNRTHDLRIRSTVTLPSHLNLHFRVNSLFHHLFSGETCSDQMFGFSNVLKHYGSKTMMLTGRDRTDE